MDEIVKTVLSMLVVQTIVTSMVVWLMQRWMGRRLDAFDRKREDARSVAERESDAIAKGVRSLLRSELIHEHRKWMERGYCPLESKEYVQHTYEAYHGLGGNDIGTSMYQDIMHLPTGRSSE